MPEYSACVGPALDSARFRDLGGLSREAKDAINCLAHYRITLGTSRGDFEPGEDVVRWQMALFLIRAARAVGIELPDPSDQGFRDIGDLSRSTRDAINQLAELEITDGKTRRTFAPHQSVTRSHMAKFLARFLEVALVGVGGVDIEYVFPDDPIFRDIDGLPIVNYRAVAALFEMGVVEGTSDTRFSPRRPVTRAQMALFITRMLAHTNARPAGITLQPGDSTVYAQSSLEIVVSVRDRNQRPVADASVDLFYAPPRDDPFETNGRCDEDEVTPEFGDDVCVIDRDDDTTDEDGNLLYDLEVDDDLVLYAWTGDLRDRFDQDRTDYAAVEYSAVNPAIAFEVTDGLHPEALKVPYGHRVTFTFQLVDEDGEPVAEEDVEINIRSEEETGTRARPRTLADVYGTDSSGRVERSFRIDRPRSGTDTLAYVELEILDSDGLDVIDENTGMILDGNIRIEWSGEDEEPTTLVLEQDRCYHSASTSRSSGQNRVTATLVDQYGDPVRSEKIHFLSDDPEGLYRDPVDQDMAQSRYRKPTLRGGQAMVRYSRSDSQPNVETIWAFRVSEDGNIRSKEDVSHFWVVEAPVGRRLDGYEVLVHDEGRDTLVIWNQSEGPYVVAYDSDDQFNRGTSTERPESFAENLKEGDSIDVLVESHYRDDINSFTRYSASSAPSVTCGAR